MTNVLKCFYSGLILILALSFHSCSKSSFLDAKSSSNLVIPSSLQDFQQLLDNQQVMQETGSLGILSSDEYFLQDNFWATLAVKEQNAYIWAPDIYAGQGVVVDWNNPYKQIFYANVILEGLKKIQINPSIQDQYNQVAGSAYFIRGYAFYNLARLFTPTYDSSSAETDLGLPLKLKADINEIEPRSSVRQTYEQILSDLYQAVALLPSAVPVKNRNRPSKPAAYALLARIFLSARNYLDAGRYADSSLQLYSTLIDYNTGEILSQQNDETLFQSNVARSSNALFYLLFGDNAFIDSSLYTLYDSNDLRPLIFFLVNDAGNYNLVNTYDGYGYCFTGLATDECYLIRAECNVRSGNTGAAMNDLNTLLLNRYLTGTFIPHTAVDKQDALSQILLERRKELFLRGLRFTDLRRLNKEGYNITLTRKLNGQTYTLPPNSPLYVMPIPPDEIALSKIQQNSR